MLDIKYTDEEITRINLVLKWTELQPDAGRIYFQYANNLENLIVNGKLVQIRPTIKYVQIYPVENGGTVPITYVFTDWRCRYDEPLNMEDIINIFHYWGIGGVPPERDYNKPIVENPPHTKIWFNPHNMERFELYYSFQSSTLVLDHLHESGRIYCRIVNPPRIGALN